MKTNRSLTMLKLFGLAILAVGLFTSLASAQECAGQFTLPVETRCGTAVLPAGDYSFALDTVSPRTLVVRCGGEVVALIVTVLSHQRPWQRNQERPEGTGRSDCCLLAFYQGMR